MKDAEVLLRRAHAARDSKLGAFDPDTLASVTSLANLLEDLGEMDESEKLFRQALHGTEKANGRYQAVLCAACNFGSDVSHVVRYLWCSESIMGTITYNTVGFPPTRPFNGLANLLWYPRREPWSRLGPYHRSTTTAVNNLANLLEDRAKLDEVSHASIGPRLVDPVPVCPRPKSLL